jgi:hypothetical protein
MADALVTLSIKDGTGASSGLTAVSSSTGYATAHILTGDVATQINQNIADIEVYAGQIYNNTRYNTTSSAQYLSDIKDKLSVTSDIAVSASIGYFSYTDITNGSTRGVSSNSSRKSVLLFNHTNGDVFISIGSGVTPTNYTYVLSASGSYFSERQYANLAHYVSGSTGVTTGKFMITSIY